jgi:hypothetical protein
MVFINVQTSYTVEELLSRRSLLMCAAGVHGSSRQETIRDLNDRFYQLGACSARFGCGRRAIHRLKGGASRD